MSRRKAWPVLTSLVLVLFLSACVPSTPTTPPQSPDDIYTAVAQTVVAELTLSAGSTAVAQLTGLARQPAATPTPVPVVPLPSPTEIVGPPSFTATPSPEPRVTANPTSLPCDWALFLGDVSVPDNTAFTPGAAFIKTWRFQNIGTCAWTSAYSLVFVGGDLMGEGSAVPLPGFISPGEIVDLSVNLFAPSTPGLYRGNWMLSNPAGVLFGVGPNAADSFRAQIQVVPLIRAGDYAYDFSANYCAANWSSGFGTLGCPTLAGDPNGVVILLDRPDLESRQEDEPALWTRPNEAFNGWISGQYPPVMIRDGDRLVTEVGCLNGSRGCEVIFALDYQLSDGRIRNLGNWAQSYDGLTDRIDIDLSGLAGLPVEFIFSVYNNGSAANGDAFWLVPHIQGTIPAAGLVLTWHQEGSAGISCNELMIYLTSRSSGEARGFSCRGNRQESGSIRLTEDEARQVSSLFSRLKTFDAEVYSASTDPVTARMRFIGGGSADATSNDILTLQNLASQLFTAINTR